MTSHEFAQKLWGCGPQEEKLVKRGCDPSVARELQENYHCRLREKTTPIEAPLVDLVTNYELSHVQIGGVAFLEPQQKGEKILVAEVDGSPIYVKGKRVYWAYREDLDDVISVCANSEEQFLDALAEMACYFVQVSMDEELYEDKIVEMEHVTKCSELAGGNEFRPFWAGMFGSE